ncbi:hypothetical protein [Streptomyces rimosus]|uniref:hypothetical protein n=1 Tax=Streptomyces rimosus TaxID=1927 RepID=UPI0004C87EF0|nr:hypothetical protein [Streptomyces rimosus]
MNESELPRGQGGRRLIARFSQRLNELIAALYPDERHRPGYAKLAAQIRETTGGTISATYLWELATGKKRNVTLEQLDVLAEFFGVPPEYFFDDDAAERIASELKLATALRDVRVRNLALRADGLSSEALDALLTMVNEARRIQHLPDAAPPAEQVAGDSPSP